MGRLPLKDHHYAMQRWDWEANTLDPSTLDLVTDSDTECVWRCRNHHLWTATLGELMTRGPSWYCPECYPFEDPPATYEDSFAARYPAAAALWDQMRFEQATSGEGVPAKDLQPGNYGAKLLFMCPQPRHMAATVSTIDFIMGHIQEGRYCHKCQRNRKYDRVAPGQTFMGPPAATSATERRLSEGLGKYFELAMPGVNALMYGAEFRGQAWGRPDIIIPGLRVVVEFDGAGMGLEMGHDTAEGRAADLDKDKLTRAVGWEVVRVRTGGADSLGPYDITIPADSSPHPADVAWQVLLAATNLETLETGATALKEPALQLLQDGA